MTNLTFTVYGKHQRKYVTVRFQLCPLQILLRLRQSESTDRLKLVIFVLFYKHYYNSFVCQQITNTFFTKDLLNRFCNLHSWQFRGKRSENKLKIIQNHVFSFIDKYTCVALFYLYKCVRIGQNRFNSGDNPIKEISS